MGCLESRRGANINVKRSMTADIGSRLMGWFMTAEGERCVDPQLAKVTNSSFLPKANQISREAPGTTVLRHSTFNIPVDSIGFPSTPSTNAFQQPNHLTVPPSTWLVWH